MRITMNKVQKEETSDKYVLVHRKTGKPLTIHTESNHGKDFCGDVTCTLSDYDDYSMFMVDTLEEAIKTLYFDVDWYNSSETHPCHGQFTTEEMKIMRMKVIYSEVDYIPPLILSGLVHTRDIPQNVAKQITPDFIKTDNKYCVCLVKNSDYTVDELKKHMGSNIYFDPYTNRKLLGVAKAREEWADQADFELVCSCL